MLPERVTAAIFACEGESAREWAKREHVELKTLNTQKLVRAVFTQEASGERFFLQGLFDTYKALPPEWAWCDSDWSGGGNRSLSPESAPTPYGSSMFLNHGGRAVICAHFNRLAFNAYDGPHGDWGELSHWMSASQGHVYAVTIADMLNSIVRDFQCATGRMA